MRGQSHVNLHAFAANTMATAREYMYKLYKKLYETIRDKSVIHNLPNNAMIGNFQSR